MDAANAVEGLLGMAAIGGLSTDMLERNGVEGCVCVCVLSSGYMW